MPTDPRLHPRSAASESTGVRGQLRAPGSQERGVESRTEVPDAPMEALLIAPAGRGRIPNIPDP